MGNGDEPEPEDNPYEPEITTIELSALQVVDDTGYQYNFHGNIILDMITIQGETQAKATMKRITVRK